MENIKYCVILDEFSYMCFKDIGNCRKLGVASWKREIEEFKPEFIFIESAWYGNDGEWQGQLNNMKKGSEIEKLLRYCGDKGIPRIFWNKEDPAHFSRFLTIARLFDYVFTTDKASIDRYKTYIGHDRVYNMIFAAQPNIHNPVMDMYNREEKISFPGSFYAVQFRERQHDLKRIIRVCQEYPIDIYDRNHEENISRFRFPSSLQKYIRGGLKGEEVLRAYKGYRVMINVNCIKDSMTMFSRRVFEGLACGIPIISSYSKGISSIFKGVIVSSDEEEVLTGEIIKLMEDQEYWIKKSHLGMRKVMQEHTCRMRIEYVLDKIGIKYGEQEQSVTLIAFADTQGEEEHIIEEFKKQSYSKKELVIVKKAQFTGRENQCENIKIVPQEKGKLTMGEFLKNVRGEFVGMFSSDNSYGEDYLKDLVLCCKFTDARVIGKGTGHFEIDGELFLYGETRENRHIDRMDSDRCIIAYSLFLRHFYGEGEVGREILNEEIISEERGMIFSCDRFNFIKGSISEENKKKIFI